VKTSISVNKGIHKLGQIGPGNIITGRTDRIGPDRGGY